MTPDELAHVRQRLEAFAVDVFAPLARSDQRAKGETYLRGLLLDGQRKSMQPMAERLGVDHQGLQQFVTTSTWDTDAVRVRLARKAVEAIDPVAWAVDDSGFPKDGTSSPGVARQYSGTLGKVANCQIGVSVHAVTDTASCPLGWRLFLPESWDTAKAGPAAVKAAKAKRRKTLKNAPRVTAPVGGQAGTGAEVDVAAVTEAVRARRNRCGMPEEEGHRPKWTLAVEMLDELAEHGLRPPVLVADAGYGDNSQFRAALDQRDIAYSVQLKGEALAHTSEAVPVTREWSGTGRCGRPPADTPVYTDEPVSLARHVAATGREAALTVTWREGSKGALSSQFVFLRVRPAGHRVPRSPEDGALPQRWLIAEWPDGEPEPVTYWLSSLPATTSPADLIRYAKIRWRIEHDYRELKTALGLDHFEGRSWQGWHRHVTLVTAAHLFLTLLRGDPKAAAPA
ncbi:IS701 family transposase [Lentzea sp. BCCO 10_0856]|uniref:IS701 family transposase n=1 Tax=Lentzea miocenica TaxID=3095431 RepID=A0ABU4THI0_9PSEU|nr:IS701 family transposase [Lentzea sp. BCCO 10_0856]MDX8037651.1 IS701 family transposase [Lentzea sp. BCCO 10_0856]